MLPEETLVPGAAALLERRDLQGLVASERWFGTRRHGIRWGSTALRWRPTDAGARGFQVVRRDLDRALTQRAVAAGVELRSSGGGVHSAAVKVVATGKSAAPPAFGVSTADALPGTVALFAFGESVAEFSDATVIEAVPEGWWWWLPIRSGEVCITLFADAEDVANRGRAAVWASARRAGRGPSGTAPDDIHGAVVATPRRRATAAPVLLTGDAASSIDPLSSQGLEKALGSAEHAALVAATILERPDDADELRQWHADWERGLFEAHARRTLALYAEERRFVETGAVFWDRRHAAHRQRTPLATDLPRRMRRAPDVIDARVWHPAPGEVLVPAPAFRLGTDPPVDRVADVPLAALFSLVEEPLGIDTLLERARGSADFFHLTASQVRTAVEVAWQRGLVASA
ncbi:MAG: hypothetical protein CMJ18_27020 [Phycisphaeraceae bacterium]|nr:hypothetical protein [Phycisphaeraceae bacterium]